MCSGSSHSLSCFERSREMTRLRALVVEDEPLARAYLCKMLAQDPELELIGECDTGLSALRAIEADPPDLVLLDIQMPEMDGFEMLAALGPHRKPSFVFVTAFDHYALKAFEVH